MSIKPFVAMFFVAGVLLGVSGCGGVSAPASATFSNTALQGNWNLLGTSAFSQPALDLSIVVNGNQITASGNELIQCTGNKVSGGSLSLSGQIAADGTFMLNQVNTAAINGDALQVSVRGSVPAAGSTMWSGSYTFALTPGTGCSPTQTGSFTAQPIEPVQGTYGGNLSQLGSLSSPSSGTLAMTLVLSQGAATSTNFPGGLTTISYFPVTGTVTVSGSSCFTHGTLMPANLSRVQGDSVNLIFTMDDGTMLAVNGYLAGTSASSIQSVAVAPLLPSSCSASFAGALTRQ